MYQPGGPPPTNLSSFARRRAEGGSPHIAFKSLSRRNPGKEVLGACRVLRGKGLPSCPQGYRYNGLNMIAHLRGKLLAKHPNQAIVETAGVGYDVIISVPTFSDLPGVGAEVALHIHTHVREDQIALYGFLRPSEKTLFEKLITVSGIGPKLAITILSGMAADEMVNAIRGNDIARLTRIPGIGKKTAERMVLELRDKLTVEKAGEVAPASALSAVEEDA